MKKNISEKKKTTKLPKTKKTTQSSKTNKTGKKMLTKPVAKHSTEKKKTKAPSSTGKMDHLQQCIVLAAIINQQRTLNSQFLLLPLAEINSMTFSPLHDLLAKHAFNPADIMKAEQELLASKEFKTLFPLPDTIKLKKSLDITEDEPKAVMTQLLLLGGPEVKKIIYFKLNGPHDIHKTTLEKLALKTQQIDILPTHNEKHLEKDARLDHRKTLTQVNKQHYFPENGSLSGKQHRGRG